MTPEHRPTNFIELQMSVEQAMAKDGPNCSLNHIDVSQCRFMQRLFSHENPITSAFNGDISGWDVAHVVNMDGMFEGSAFNGDVSQWDVRGVQSMAAMFKNSAFDGDLSKWQSPINDTNRLLELVSKTAGTYEKLKLPIFNVPIAVLFDVPWRTSVAQPADAAMLDWLASHESVCRYHWDLLVEEQDVRWKLYEQKWATRQVLDYRASLEGLFETMGIVQPLEQARMLDEGWRRLQGMELATALPELFDTKGGQP